MEEQAKHKRTRRKVTVRERIAVKCSIDITSSSSTVSAGAYHDQIQKSSFSFEFRNRQFNRNYSPRLYDPLLHLASAAYWLRTRSYPHFVSIDYATWMLRSNDPYASTNAKLRARLDPRHALIAGCEQLTTDTLDRRAGHEVDTHLLAQRARVRSSPRVAHRCCALDLHSR